MTDNIEWSSEHEDNKQYFNPPKRRTRNIINILEPTSYVIHHQFNIQQLYALPTLYLCVLNLSENKQRLVPLTV
jgi:hypothetical protein